MSKDKRYQQLIHTGQWLRLRERRLTEHPACERCAAEGRITPAAEVHHVMPVEDALSVTEMRRRMFDYGNLRALCHECHVRAHIELASKSKAKTKEREAAKLRDFRSRFL